MINDFSGDYDFLSNFYHHTFFWYGRLYLSVEHSYQAAKATNQGDFLYVASAPWAGDAKKRGRQIKIRPDWEEAKFYLMKDMLFHKFKDRTLAERLVDTTGNLLVEGNTWHDNIWGDCHCGRPKCAKPGQNALGQQLMVLRWSLQEEYGVRKVNG
jgi:ribA/ribD-fused uncharacterized protein